ncbi:hypothetical protein FV225_20035, partial [Methylobacterium sp. WL93]
MTGGVSQTKRAGPGAGGARPVLGLFEQIVYRDGARQSRNDNTDPIRREHRPAVHVRIVESGAPTGGVGAPGLPWV